MEKQRGVGVSTWGGINFVDPRRGGFKAKANLPVSVYFTLISFKLALFLAPLCEAERGWGEYMAKQRGVGVSTCRYKSKLFSEIQ